MDEWEGSWIKTGSSSSSEDGWESITTPTDASHPEW